MFHVSPVFPGRRQLTSPPLLTRPHPLHPWSHLLNLHQVWGRGAARRFQHRDAEAAVVLIRGSETPLIHTSKLQESKAVFLVSSCLLNIGRNRNGTTTITAQGFSSSSRWSYFRDFQWPWEQASSLVHVCWTTRSPGLCRQRSRDGAQTWQPHYEDRLMSFRWSF